MRGRAIKIFLVDGTTTGLKVVEIGLSTAKGVLAPRGSLEALSKREEARRTGVYILLGEDPEVPGRTALYVGEGDDVFSRIIKHDRDTKKDFFDRVALFVSKDANLTKAHIRYLEAQLVETAKRAKRATVVNGTAPIGGSLPEADTAEMDEFLEHIRIMLSSLGVSAFEQPPTRPATTSNQPSDGEALELTYSGDGYSATCLLQDGQFVVQAGSVARTAEAPSLSNASSALRKELLDAGVLRSTPKGLLFEQDYAFGSASGAAQAVCGANVNGRISWKLDDGTTFKDWQETHTPAPTDDESNEAA